MEPEIFFALNFAFIDFITIILAIFYLLIRKVKEISIRYKIVYGFISILVITTIYIIVSLQIIEDIIAVSSLIVIGFNSIIFIMIYVATWSTKEISFSHKVAYGIIFIFTSFIVYLVIIFQLSENPSLALFINIFVSVNLLSIMMSDIAGDENVRRLRVGRMIFYSICLGIGLIALIALYIIIFMGILVFGVPIQNIVKKNLNHLLFFVIFGCILFIISIWGINKEEKHGTEGKLKGSALTWLNIIFLIISLVTFTVGLTTLGDIGEYHFLQIYPNYNYILGVLYFPIGLFCLIISIWKLIKDYRYRKQFFNPPESFYTDPIIIVSKYGLKLGLNYEMQKKIEKFIECLPQKLKEEKDPKCLCAAAIYIVGKVERLNLSKEKIAEIFDIPSNSMIIIHEEIKSNENIDTTYSTIKNL